MSVPFGPYGGGHRCSVCGAWVPTGFFHNCGGRPTYPPTPSYTPPDPMAANTAALHALANAINRLVVAITLLDTAGRANAPEDAQTTEGKVR